MFLTLNCCTDTIGARLTHQEVAGMPSKARTAAAGAAEVKRGGHRLSGSASRGGGGGGGGWRLGWGMAKIVTAAMAGGWL